MLLTFLLPFLLSTGTPPDRVLRAIAGITLFISAIYWVFSYLMALVSQRLDVSLGVGER